MPVAEVFFFDLFDIFLAFFGADSFPYLPPPAFPRALIPGRNALLGRPESR
jgi:hypothetical protein